MNNRFNKATLSALVGALITISVGVWPDVLTAEMQAAVQTILVTLFVIFIPNKEPPK